MPKTISISTDVYAAIWADRQNGEESEEDILRRKFGIKSGAAQKSSARVAWADHRFKVQLTEGQEVFRVYKGKEYRAKASNGYLIRTDNNVSFTSLNKLSRSIGAGTENAWNNWYVVGKDGKRMLINELRLPN